MSLVVFQRSPESKTSNSSSSSSSSSSTNMDDECNNNNRLKINDDNSNKAMRKNRFINFFKKNIDFNLSKDESNTNANTNANSIKSQVENEHMNRSVSNEKTLSATSFNDLKAMYSKLDNDKFHSMSKEERSLVTSKRFSFNQPSSCCVVNQKTDEDTQSLSGQQHEQQQKQALSSRANFKKTNSDINILKRYGYGSLKIINSKQHANKSSISRHNDTNNKELGQMMRKRYSDIECRTNSIDSTQLTSPDVCIRKSRNLIENYFVVKDAALILPRRSSQIKFDLIQTPLLSSYEQARSMSNEQVESSEQASDSTTTQAGNSSSSNPTGDILLHLHAMIALLRPNDTIILAVKLFSYVPDKTRYMVIVETKSTCSSSSHLSEQSAIIGLDIYPNQSARNANEERAKSLDSDEKQAENDSNQSEVDLFNCSVGLVLPIYADSDLMLDGDGGFIYKSHESTHIFKPVSIQAMWSAYQYLHKAFENARKFNFYPIDAVPTTASVILRNSSEPSTLAKLSSNSERNVTSGAQNDEWIKYYLSKISKNAVEQQTNLNEWYEKEPRTAQRDDFTTPYFDCFKLCKEQEEMGAIIKEKLKEIMMNSIDDCGSMSSVYIRELLERELKRKLDDFKKYIDATIFLCYNQLVEKATQILPSLYLGTEWNASNYDALINHKVTHILNVSNEVDNFFPDAFKYLNVRVRDNEDTDLLKEFDRTNRFIQEAKDQGTSCLVHCKMGVSRSASVVLAYLMKEFDYSFPDALQFAKQKRTCIKPNDGFKHQLLTYESILNAHKAKKTIFEPQQQTSPLSSQSSNTCSSEANSEFKSTSGELNLTQTRTVRDVVNKINIGRFVNDSTSLTPSCLTTPPSQSGVLLSPPLISSCSTSPNSHRNCAIKNEKSDESKTVTHHMSISTRATSQTAEHNATAKSASNSEEDVKTPTSNRHFRSKSISELSNVNETSKTESCRQQFNLEDLNSNYVPLGTVKRQVESINIKSRPFSMQPMESQHDQENFKRQTRNSMCESYDLGSDKKYFQNSDDLKYLPSLVIFNSLTKSPDSKRFKSNQLKYNNSSSDSTVAALSKSFEFKRSKQVFEQLQSKQIKTGETKS